MLEDPGIRILLIIGIGAVLILLPLGAARYMRGEAKLWGKALDAARNPWKKDNDDLEELSRRVEELKD